VKRAARQSVHVGIDTGGTFTDFLVVHAGGAFRFKVPSTPADPAQAFHQGLALAARRLLADGIDVAATRPGQVAHRPAENLGPPGGRIDQLHEQLEGGGFAGAVRPEEPENLSLPDGEVERVQRPVWARAPEADVIVLGKVLCSNGVHRVIG
jgi:hypothetical protein